MQNYCKTIGALAAASALVAGNAQAEVEYEMHTGYSSEYLYRGVNMGQDLVEVGADVKTTMWGLDLSAGAWYGSFEQNNENTKNSTELDLYLGVAKDFGFLTGSVGYINRQYDVPRWSLDDTTQEISFGVARDFGFMEAALTYYWGIEDIRNSGVTDGYTELALRRSFEINQCLSLQVGTNVGYLVEGGDFTAWTTKVALDWGFAEHAKLSPFVALSIALGESDDSLWSGNGGGGPDNEFIAGSMLSVNF